MGKDVMKDLTLLDEHLTASNAPSKLVSMKLESLRKGFNIGHCIYSREPALGNQGPGVDGVFDKREKRSLGYSDADLARRFQDSAGLGSGQLMDEATIKKLMAAERQKHQRDDEEPPKKKDKDKGRKRSRGRSKSKRKKSRSRNSERDHSSSRSRKRDKDKSKEKGRGRRKSPSGRRSRSRSKHKKKKSRSPSPHEKRKKGKS